MIELREITEDIPEYDIWHMMIDESTRDTDMAMKPWIGSLTISGQNRSANRTESH